MKPEDKQLTKSDIEKVVGEPIADFSTSSGSNKGDNVAGSLLAIKVTTVASPNKPLHLVYKSFPDMSNPEQRQFIIQFGIFRTETCVYEKILPRIQELLEKRPNMLKKTLPAPKYISGFNDDENDYVALEDLRHQDFIMQDKFHSLTVPEVTLVMKEIARFHALTHLLIRYDGERIFDDNERIRRIKHNAFTNENPIMKEMFSRMFNAYMQATVELLEPRNKELSEHVGKFVEKYNHHKYRELQRFNMDRTDKKVFPCIIHGDLWTNNILFKYGEKGNRDTPTDIKFIDFQMTRRGNIFEDLGYFFWTSTTPDFRKGHLTTMLGIYYDSFDDTMKQLEWPKPEGFTKGFLLDGFNEGILSAYVYMPFALSLQMGDLTFTNESMLKSDEGQEEQIPNGTNGEEKKDAIGEGGPPPMNFDKMAEEAKKLMKLRMINSTRAMDRLEDLTKEIADMGLLN